MQPVYFWPSLKYNIAPLNELIYRSIFRDAMPNGQSSVTTLKNILVFTCSSISAVEFVKVEFARTCTTYYRAKFSLATDSKVAWPVSIWTGNPPILLWTLWFPAPLSFLVVKVSNIFLVLFKKHKSDSNYITTADCHSGRKLKTACSCSSWCRCQHPILILWIPIIILLS